MTRVKSHIIVVHSEQSLVGAEDGLSVLSKPPNATPCSVGAADGSIVGSEVGLDVGGSVGAGPMSTPHMLQHISFPARQHDLKGDPSHRSSRVVGGGEGD